jgi:hypothetical protein
MSILVLTDMKRRLEELEKRVADLEAAQAKKLTLPPKKAGNGQ